MRNLFKNACCFFIALSFFGCNETNNNNPDSGVQSNTTMVEKLISKEERDAMSPDEIIQNLKDGNQRFLDNKLIPRNLQAQAKNSGIGQNPMAIVLSCVDSRIPVEHLLDQGIGDVFVARIAGNFINTDILGSMEFACHASGSKVIMVLGHEECGAVKSTISNIDIGNITPMLARIRPAIGLVEYDGDRSVNNKEFVSMVCESNVRNTMHQIRARSTILDSMVANNHLKIVGAVYDMKIGKIELLE